MKPLLTALALLALLQDSTLETSLRKLAELLDHEQVAQREVASVEFRRIGEPALPFLRKLVADAADPDTKARAAEIVRLISIDLVLARPGNEILRKGWAAVTGTDERARLTTVHLWAAGAGKSPEGVATCLELMQLEPAGPAGSAAAIALNWIGANRTATSLHNTGRGMAWTEPIPSTDYFRHLAGDALRFSKKALAVAEARTLGSKSELRSISVLGELYILCWVTGLCPRLEDATGAIHIETREEAQAAWGAWWKSIKDDPVLLIDAGLRPAPSAAEFKAADLDTWAPLLASAEPRKARVARSILKDLSDDLVPELAKRGAADFAARLAFRSKGRIAFVAEGLGAKSAFVMNLDGSGVRKVSGDLGLFFAGIDPVQKGEAAFEIARLGKEDWAIWRLDLTGATEPRRIADGLGFCWIWPLEDGSRLAVRTEKSSSLLLIDPATGASKVLEEKSVEQVDWSPKGDRLAWTRGGREIAIHDPARDRTVRIDDIPLSLVNFQWSPDGSSILAVLKSGEKSRVLERIDAATGKRERLAGPHGWIYDPSWSPDGRRISFLWAETVDDPVTIEILGGREPVRHQPFAKPGKFFGGCRWDPDGRTLWFHQTGVEGVLLVDGDTGKATPRPGLDPHEVRFIPESEWLLLDHADDIFLVSRDGQTRLNLTESALTESGPKWLPPARRR